MDSGTRRTRPGRTRALALLGAVIVCGGTVAACSSGGSSSATGSSSAPAGAAKTLTNITIGYPSLTIHLLPFQVAIDQGFFAKQGLNVKLVSLNNSQTTIAGLTSNSVQFAGVGSSGVLAAAAQGAPVISVLAQDNGVPQISWSRQIRLGQQPDVNLIDIGRGKGPRPLHLRSQWAH